MRGITGEILAFVIISISLLVLAMFFSVETTLKGGEVIKTITERKIDESAQTVIFTLFNNRVDTVQKTYIEAMMDACLQNKTGDEVFYGQAIGTLYPFELIDPLFNKYMGKFRWKIKLIGENCTLVRGELPENRVLYTYFVEVPYPPEKIGNMTLYIG